MNEIALTKCAVCQNEYVCKYCEEFKRVEKQFEDFLLPIQESAVDIPDFVRVELAVRCDHFKPYAYLSCNPY